MIKQVLLGRSFTRILKTFFCSLTLSVPVCAQLVPTSATPPAPAQPPIAAGSCNDACSSAIGKEYVIVGFSGNSSNVALWDQTHSERYPTGQYAQQSSVSSPPTAPYSFLGASSGSYVASVLMDITQYQSFGLAEGRSNFSPSMQNGFSFGMMVYVEDPSVTNYVNSYYTFVLKANSTQPGFMVTAIRKGSQWGLAVKGTSGAIPISQFPWDANSFQTGPGWNYVFYTINPDGKCRIDVFYNSVYNSALLDFGNAGLSYNSGSATSNPSAPLYPTQDSTVSFSMQSPGKGFESIQLFSSPLTPAEASGFYAGSYQGSYTDQGGTACNTGYALNVQTIGSSPPTQMPATPCGSTSNWSNTVPAGAAVTLSTTDLQFSTQASPQPYESPDQAITVTNSGDAPLSISAVTLAGDNPNDFSVDSDSCSGTSLAPGASCTLQVGYTDYDQRADATLQVQTNAAAPAPVVTLEGENG